MWTSALAVVLFKVIAVATVGVDARVVGAPVRAEQTLCALALLRIGVGAGGRAGLAVVGVEGLVRRGTERATELLHAHGADDVAGQAGEDAVLELDVAPDHRALHGGRSGAEEPGDGRRARGHEGSFLAGDHDVARAVGQGLRFAVQIAGEGDGGAGEEGDGHGHGEHGLFHQRIP